jgi:hypothetical protein
MAFGHETWPLILPVNYVYDDPHVIVRTDAESVRLRSLPITSVAPGDHTHALRITAVRLSGRAVGPAALPTWSVSPPHRPARRASGR